MTHEQREKELETKRRRYADDKTFRENILEARRRRYAEDPKYRARLLEYGRAYRQRRKITPELRAKWREQGRRRYKDPVWRAKLLSRRKETGQSERARWMHRYGITEADYNRMLTTQGGCCALCKQPPDAKSRHGVLAIDHDHETGQVRGLLCFLCNHGLGGYERLQKVAGLDAVNRYLAGWPEVELRAIGQR